MGIILTKAVSDEHLQGILDLQHKNHLNNINPDNQNQQGFVFVKHDIDTLRKMSKQLPQAICLYDNKVIGYNLAMDISMREFIPCLVPMFEQLSKITYKNKALLDYKIFFGGQVCVDIDFRGNNLLEKMYKQNALSILNNPPYELCITEVSVRNQVSLKAHKKMGFETIHRYFEKENWEIIAWKCT